MNFIPYDKLLNELTVIEQILAKEVDVQDPKAVSILANEMSVWYSYVGTLLAAAEYHYACVDKAVDGKLVVAERRAVKILASKFMSALSNRCRTLMTILSRLKEEMRLNGFAK